MLKQILATSGKILLDPITSIVILCLLGTGFIFYGTMLIFGTGAAFVTTGVLLLLYTAALIRSVSGG